MKDRIFKVVDEHGKEWSDYALSDYAMKNLPRLAYPDLEGVLIDENGNPYLADRYGTFEYIDAPKFNVVMLNERTCHDIGKGSGHVFDFFECSECGCYLTDFIFVNNSASPTSYCPNCGAKVVEK